MYVSFSLVMENSKHFYLFQNKSNSIFVSFIVPIRLGLIVAVLLCGLKNFWQLKIDKSNLSIC